MAHGVNRSRLLGWIGWAGLDALGRLALLTVSTVILSRVLLARDFGEAALVLAIVATASLFVGAPFEEALAQRRAVRRMHMRAALGVSVFVGILIVAVTLVASPWLARVYGEPDIAFLLPLCMLSVFPSGHADVMTALARRLRRFNDVARANLYSHVIGIVVSVVLAFMGYGTLALIIQRLLISLAKAVLLQQSLGYRMIPAWSQAHLNDLWRFSSISFMSRLIDNVTYLIFNNLVQLLYGVTMLGHVNMAMRLIEPVRGAIVATGHNLAFSFFAKAGHDRAKLRALAELVVSQSAFMTVPVFIGIAAVAPVLMPVVAGPGWEDTISILACFAVASAIGVPSGMIFTAFSADAQPQFGLVALVAGLVAMILVLAGFHWLGPISVGLSRIAYDGVRALIALFVASTRLKWPSRARVDALAPAWLLASAMGIVTALIGYSFDTGYLVVKLFWLISLGVVLYVALMRIFARTTFTHFLSFTPLGRASAG